MPDKLEVLIRAYNHADRKQIRRICIETAFAGVDRHKFFSDDEVLADALIRYFTDYEPQSCFVAVSQGRVIGYIAGSVNAAAAGRISNIKVMPRLFLKALARGVFLRWINLRFFGAVLLSIFKGEFSRGDYSREYPALLHINIDEGFRGRQAGRRLVEHYLRFLKDKGAPGVHLSTMSDNGREFFSKLGFTLLWQGSRSYLRYQTGEDVPLYILSKRLCP